MGRELRGHALQGLAATPPGRSKRAEKGGNREVEVGLELPGLAVGDDLELAGGRVDVGALDVVGLGIFEEEVEVREECEDMAVLLPLPIQPGCSTYPRAAVQQVISRNPRAYLEFLVDHEEAHGLLDLVIVVRVPAQIPPHPNRLRIRKKKKSVYLRSGSWTKGSARQASLPGST